VDWLFNSFWAGLLILGLPATVLIWLLRRPVDERAVPKDAVAMKGKAGGGVTVPWNMAHEDILKPIDPDAKMATPRHDAPQGQLPDEGSTGEWRGAEDPEDARRSR
jgi:hypothetical protein